MEPDANRPSPSGRRARAVTLSSANFQSGARWQAIVAVVEAAHRLIEREQRELEELAPIVKVDVTAEQFDLFEALQELGERGWQWER